MNCGIPFCHHGCPLGNVIPEFNDAVYRQQWQEAYEILSSTNNFPEFTGRICPAPCESSCVLGINQATCRHRRDRTAYHRNSLRKAIRQSQPSHRFIPAKKSPSIGSSPAGLAAADQLNVGRSYQVTVFERDDGPGGLAALRDPRFQTGKWVVARRIRLMEEAGITFKCNAEVGVRHLRINDLLREFHAIVLAGGSTIPRDLPIPGRHLKGVHFAHGFSQTTKQTPQQYSPLRTAQRHPRHRQERRRHRRRRHRQRLRRHLQPSQSPLHYPIRTAAETTTRPYRHIMPWPTYPMTPQNASSSHEEGAEQTLGHRHQRIHRRRTRKPQSPPNGKTRMENNRRRQGRPIQRSAGQP